MKRLLMFIVGGVCAIVGGAMLYAGGFAPNGVALGGVLFIMVGAYIWGYVEGSHEAI